MLPRCRPRIRFAVILDNQWWRLEGEYSYLANEQAGFRGDQEVHKPAEVDVYQHAVEKEETILDWFEEVHQPVEVDLHQAVVERARLSALEIVHGSVRQ